MTEIKFKGYNKVEPEDLISFSREYESYRVNELIPALYKTVGKITTVITMRMGHDGFAHKKSYNGRIGEIHKNGFFLKFGDTEQEGKFINFYNILGEVPLLLTAPDDLNPYKMDSSETLMGYFPKLNEMIELLKTCEGTEKSVKLFFRYDKEHKLFRNGDYVVECEVLKVNRSNVEINELLIRSFTSKENFYSEVGSGEKVISFISSDCYLHKVIVSDCKNKINPCDEDES